MERSAGGLDATSPTYWAEKAKPLIDKRYSDLSGICEVSSILGISETHFRRVFRSAYTKSPRAYLQEVRIEWSSPRKVDKELSHS